MKRLLLCAILFAVITVASVSAWEPSDLTKFPSCMNDNDWILNLGVGLGGLNDLGKKNYIWLPPLRMSFDKNVPLGDKLPFFFGGLVGYAGYGWKNSYFNHRITTGFRIGYHFNWGVDNLDTYAVTTGGWTFHAYTGDYKPYDERFGKLYTGVSVGVRYFVSESFGFWAETGYNQLSWFDIGLTFKF